MLATKRALLLITSIFLNYGLIAIFLIAREEVDDETSDDPLDYMWIGLITAGIVWVVVIILDILIAKFWLTHRLQNLMSALTWIAMIVLILIGIIIVVAITFQICEEWDVIWLLVLLVSFLFEILILESITALVKVAFKARVL